MILQLEIIVKTTSTHATDIFLRLVALFTHVARQCAQHLISATASLAYIRCWRSRRRRCWRHCRRCCSQGGVSISKEK